MFKADLSKFAVVLVSIDEIFASETVILPSTLIFEPDLNFYSCRYFR